MHDLIWLIGAATSWERLESECVLVLQAVLQFLPVGLVITSGLLLYRWLKLESIPWIAAHYTIAPFTSYITRWLARHVEPPSITVPLLALTPTTDMFVATALIVDTIDIIIVLLVLAEIVFLATQVRPDLASSHLKPLLRVHRNVKKFGIALILLTVFSPLPFFVLWRATRP